MGYFGTSFSATANFNTVGEQYYREAIQLILNGIDGVDNIETETNREPTELFDDWPFKFRIEAERYWPRGQRLLGAVQWPAVVGGFRRELSVAGALLVTERELVVISEESIRLANFRGTITNSEASSPTSRWCAWRTLK